jgi:hypothetical protein
LVNVLPNGLKSVSEIYQRPSGEIAIFVGDHLYMMAFLSLRLVIDYPKHITAMGIRQRIKFNAVVNSYTGKSFSFYNDNYYMEIDECTMKAKNYGMISKSFPGLPPSTDVILRV